MQARITADDLAKDVSGAETLISRHKENKTEIDARVKDITRFTQKGKALIAEKNFMASEVCHSVVILNSYLRQEYIFSCVNHFDDFSVQFHHALSFIVFVCGR